MLLATTTVEDFDRFTSVFSTKGAEKRRQHGTKTHFGVRHGIRIHRWPPTAAAHLQRDPLGARRPSAPRR